MGYYDETVLSTDYEGRCGNCHARLGKKDKYCRYCGTPVGEGKFKPYRNEIYCVYGPPVKELRVCPDCGYKWRSTVMGGDNAKFCPICGGKNLEIVESVAKDMFGDYAATVDLDVVDLDHPEYFTADEIETILSLRSEEPFDEKQAIKKLIAAGFSECEKAWMHEGSDDHEQIPDMTDREAERINMGLFMLEHVKGKRPYHFPHIQCPKCKGNTVAVVLEERKTSSNLPGRALQRGLYQVGKGGWHTGNYHCLLCDKYFD